MKVLALISGGKDSIFNIVKCMEEGHQIIALGNMYNIAEQTQGIESDSYMYQTVGTNISVCISEALELPIYRKQISGKPKVMNLEYEGGEEEKHGDEVEDLFELVKEVKAVHPEINAISTGAIFSTYQKLRVENICQRLNLESLAYLWHREQVALLQQMIDYPLHAIIIKVASYGLNKNDLGKTIAQLQPKFLNLKKQCEMNVCGEGGEFESLVLDCPLFKKRIVIDEAEVIQIEKNQLAPVAYLQIKSVHLEPK